MWNFHCNFHLIAAQSIHNNAIGVRWLAYGALFKVLLVVICIPSLKKLTSSPSKNLHSLFSKIVKAHSPPPLAKGEGETKTKVTINFFIFQFFNFSKFRALHYAVFVIALSVIMYCIPQAGWVDQDRSCQTFCN